MSANSQKPESLTLRSYNVGFGDCFLLTFHYPKEGAQAALDRHILIDFGSTSLPKGVQSDYMVRVANDIKRECGDKLHAIIATHRHADHINGFARNKDGKGSGDIIRQLKPDVVVQPWTEDPKAQKNALGPSKENDPGSSSLRALANMNAFAEAVVKATERLTVKKGKQSVEQIGFLGEDNLANPDAVKNLMTMGKNAYVYHGSKSGLERILPGVKVHVLGPPTLKQSDKIRKQRAKDQDEFWHLAARTGSRFSASSSALFPRAEVYSTPPPFARWLIPRMQAMHVDQLLEIVRILDDQMNNTSIILLIETANCKLLFPGDAQLENWLYTLTESKQSDELKALLADVNLYKVGHHGSLNATPKSLWNLFHNRGPKTKSNLLQTVVSTKAGKHGSVDRGTEVPREKLVKALENESEYHTTQTIKPADLKNTLPPIKLWK